MEYFTFCCNGSASSIEVNQVIISIRANIKIENQIGSTSMNTHILINHIFIASSWLREAHVWCRNHVKNSSETSQAACQALCKANGRRNCVGIAYDHTKPTKSMCYLCKDDVMSKTGGGLAFYRRPGTF